MLLRCWGTSSLSSSSATEWPTRPCLDLQDFLQLVWPWHNIYVCFRKYSFFCSALGIASGYGFCFITASSDLINQIRSDGIGPAALAIFLCLGESHPGLLLLILKFCRIGHWWHVCPGHHLAEPHRAWDDAASRGKSWPGWWSLSFQPVNTPGRWWSMLVSPSPSPLWPTWLPSPLEPSPKSILSSEWTVFNLILICLHCRNFCLFAILSLSFVYLYICTFFLAALAIDQRRIDAGRCVDWMEIIFMAITLMLKILIDCNNPDGNNLGGNWNLARRQ